jgi:Spy/CpxP family protein refolding chaperone
MKKLSLLLLCAILGLAFLTPAFAGRGGWGPGDGPGRGYCNGPNGGAADEQTARARQEFLDKSKELRQQLYERKDAYYELMQQETPDKEQAAGLWNEIFDLQTELQQMAADAGFKPGRWGNEGFDCGNGPRGGNGRGCNGPGGRW